MRLTRLTDSCQSEQDAIYSDTGQGTQCLLKRAERRQIDVIDAAAFFTKQMLMCVCTAVKTIRHAG